jgi:hypothetical protein
LVVTREFAVAGALSAADGGPLLLGEK